MPKMPLKICPENGSRKRRGEKKRKGKKKTGKSHEEKKHEEKSLNIFLL